MSSIAPQVQWAQRKETVLLGFLVPDVKDLDIKFESDKVHFSFLALLPLEEISTSDGLTIFRGASGDDRHQQYETTLELYAEIEPEASAYTVKDRLVDVVLRKKDTAASFWPRLLKGASKPTFLKVDFSRWKDEDEDVADKDDDNDFASMMHKMGGAGGFGSNLGPRGGGDEPAFEPDFDPSVLKDSDDEGDDMPGLVDNEPIN